MSETVDMRGGENAVVTAEGGARNMLSTVRKFFAEPSVQRSIPTAAAALVMVLADPPMASLSAWML